MKRIFSALLAAATLFAGCTKSDVDETGLDGKVQLKLTSSIAPTRATDIAFEDGDLVGLYITKGGETLKANEKMTAYASGAIEAAAPIYYPEDGAAIDLFAYYPYVENPTVPAVWTIPAVQEGIELTNYDLCSGAVSGVKPTNKAVSILFNHLMSKVTVDLTVAGAGVTEAQKEAVKVKLLAAVSATVNAQTGEVTKVANPVEVTLTEDNTALVVPQSFAKGAKIATIETANGDLEVTAGKEMTFEAGKNNILKITLTINEYLDVNVVCTITDWNDGDNIELSKPEIVSASFLSKDGFANCYIVSKAGRYSFAAKQVDGTVISGEKADWVWMTDAALLSDINYADDEISFTASDTKGNGLIALIDADGNIVWSWHIWCTDAPAEQKWNQSTWLDRNIGATSVTKDDVNSYGMLYQWGRKDPIIGSNEAGSISGRTEPTAFAPEYTMSTVVNAAVVGEGNGWANIPGQTTVKQAARYPMCMYTYVYSNGGVVTNPDNTYGGATSGQAYGPDAQTMADWCEGGASDRWYNTAVTATGKTLNDPCPVGYMVPTQNQQYTDFLGSTDEVKWFNKANKSDVTNGLTYNYAGGSVWMPATGVRFSAYSPEGANKFIGNTSIYWNSTENNPSLGTFISINGGDMGNTCGAAMWKSFACPVRCVAEEIVIPEDKAIDLSANGTANCYVVSTSATEYKFKATVKGNGVSPVGESTTIMPAKARILWGIQEIELNAEDPTTWPVTSGADATLSSAVVYSSLQLKGGYVYFKTADEMKNGNLVICVTDANDKILWSWHIWAVNGYDVDATAQQVNLTKQGSTTTVQCTLMDRNLGATCNPVAMAAPSYSDYAHARGMFYQWGRKDPFVHMRSMNGFNPTVSWSAADGTITSALAFYTGAYNDNFVKANNTIGVAAKDLTGALDYVTANPMVFIKGGDSYTWMGPGAQDPGTEAEWGKLWGNQSGEVGAKTMYDPCPAGWRVADPKALWFVTSHADNISAMYAKPAPWKLNCKETIYDAQGNNVGAAYVKNADNKDVVSTVSPFTSEPWGLHFFIHGTKSPATGEDYDQGNLPADQTVTYFPAQGMIRNGGSYFAVGSNWAANNVVAHTNAPDASTSYGGRTKLMLAAQNGDFFYNASAASYAEQQNTGRPVRCIKE